MLAGIYWREPNFGLLEAPMASDQAEIIRTLGPLMGQHIAITLALIIHAFLYQQGLL